MRRRRCRRSCRRRLAPTVFRGVPRDGAFLRVQVLGIREVADHGIDGVLKNATDGTLLALYDITVKLSSKLLPFESTDDINTPFDRLIELMIGRPVGTAKRVLDAPITFVFVINNRLNEYGKLFLPA